MGKAKRSLHQEWVKHLGALWETELNGNQSSLFLDISKVSPQWNFKKKSNLIELHWSSFPYIKFIGHYFTLRSTWKYEGNVNTFEDITDFGGYNGF